MSMNINVDIMRKNFITFISKKKARMLLTYYGKAILTENSSFFLLINVLKIFSHNIDVNVHCQTVYVI